MPSLSSLRAFEATARTGNFVNAARSLNVTQAAVAQQVRSLEAELGVALVRRAGRTVALTQTGRQFAERLNEGFITLASAVDEVVVEEGKTPVQASVTPLVAQTILVPRIHEFLKSDPGIRVSMIPSLEAVDIAALGYDVAIRASVDVSTWPGLNSELLCESKLIVAGAPSLVSFDMPDISEMPWIFTRGFEHEEQRLRSIGLDPASLNNVELGSPTYEISAAIQGLGLIISPELLIRNELSTGQLQEVPISGLQTLKYLAITPKGPVRPTVVRFIEWLRKVFSE